MAATPPPWRHVRQSDIFSLMFAATCTGLASGRLPAVASAGGEGTVGSLAKRDPA